MKDLFPVEKADYFEIDWHYDCSTEPSTQKYKFIEDVKDALNLPLEMYDALQAEPYAVYVIDDIITRIPINPYEY